MYNILIIDDEELIRKSIIKVLETNFPALFSVFEASNATEGIKKISNIDPDIIITDICMNHMTGLEMLEATHPKAKIIVITGYRNFEYAQQAISLNVSALILKPIHFNELIKAVADAISDIDTKVQQQNRLDNLTSVLVEHLPYIRQKQLLNKLYAINTENTKSSTSLKEHGFFIDSFYLVIFEIVANNSSTNYHYNYNYMRNIQSDLLNQFKEKLCSDNNFYSTFLDFEKTIFILKNDFLIYSEEKLINICEQIGTIITNNHENVQVFASISSQGKSEDELNAKYTECIKTLNYLKTHIVSSTMSYNDIPLFESTISHHKILDIKESIISALKSNDQIAANQYITTINNLTKKLPVNELSFIQDIYCQLLLYINSLRDEVGINSSGSVNNFSNIINMIKQCDNISVLNDVLTLSVNDLFKNTSLTQKSKGINYVKQAIEYINKNYQKDISLNDIASCIYLSPVHLSRIFKKETGQNIIDYVNELRIKKSKGLLASGEYKIYEVAEMVGIKNTNYFTILFKKHYNITPREYLKSIQIASEQE